MDAANGAAAVGDDERVRFAALPRRCRSHDDPLPVVDEGHRFVVRRHGVDRESDGIQGEGHDLGRDDPDVVPDRSLDRLFDEIDLDVESDVADLEQPVGGVLLRRSGWRGCGPSLAAGLRASMMG